MIEDYKGVLKHSTVFFWSGMYTSIYTHWQRFSCIFQALGLFSATDIKHEARQDRDIEQHVSVKVQARAQPPTARGAEPPQQCVQMKTATLVFVGHTRLTTAREEQWKLTTSRGFRVA